MKVLTFSTKFPKGHPKAGQPTWFVEKVLICTRWGMTGQELLDSIKPDIKPYVNDFALITEARKYHTIRIGSRWKPGEMASLRMWSGKPYQSKQVEFGQVEVKKTWEVEIYATDFIFELKINGVALDKEGQEQVANNDGLSLIDLYNWFNAHPKKEGQVFKGQVICWSENINY